MHLLTDSQFATLTALCDTLVPGLPFAGEHADFWARPASALEVPRLFARAVRDLQSPDQQATLKTLLDALDQPALALALTGHARRFRDLDGRARERVLQTWSTSPLPPLRRAFQALRRLTAALFYTAPGADGHNPNLNAVGYRPPPPVAQPALTRVRPKRLSDGERLRCQTVVVGSGAGGSVVAAYLARTGQDVIVLEKGGAFSPADYDGHEYTAYQRLYENQAVLATEDLGVVVLAGSSLGGGTTINWAASFRTPESVLEEWARGHGLGALAGADYHDALDEVCARLDVNEAESLASLEAALFERGADGAGFAWGKIPVNVRGCAEHGPDRCAYCTFGCPLGHKRSTPVTYLADATAAGARIVCEAEAETVLSAAGRAAGVRVRLAGGGQATIEAERVVVAAGSLHTPALLLRSGLRNPNLGRHLRLHPTVAVYGEYEDRVELWRGPMLTRYSRRYADLDGRGYGVVLEHPPAHPGLLALALPWLSGAQHKQAMTRAAWRAAFIAIARDTGAGQVTIDRRGRPRLHYALNRVDQAHLLTGIEGLITMHRAAGAHEIGGPQSGLAPWRPAGPDPEAYLGLIHRIGLGPNRAMVFSAHQMGTARMGASPRTSVVGPDGACWDLPGLYVADASLFPTASGVNPMITIMALATVVARALAG
jgi:choline dehydrogenase-like flavoprotein